MSSSVFNVAFAGTPHFAAKALQAILAANFHVSLVLTQPDRPSGRGMQLKPSAVKELALSQNLTIVQPVSLRLDGKYPQDAQQGLASLQNAAPDVLVVAAYGLILPEYILNLPRYGCMNIHGSLLPRWRGAAPIQRAIEQGDAHTGICIMQMDVGLDTGDVIAQQTIPIELHDTYETLHDSLASIGAKLIVESLKQLEVKKQQHDPTRLPAVAQSMQGITYAEKVLKSETIIDWQLPALTIYRKIASLSPSPAMQTRLILQHIEKKEIYIKLRLEDIDIHDELTPQLSPGTITYIDDDRWVVACQQGALLIKTLQPQGGKSMRVKDFMNGHAVSVGDYFEARS